MDSSALSGPNLLALPGPTILLSTDDSSETPAKKSKISEYFKII